MFLQEEESGVRFAVWSSNGAALVYKVISLDSVFKLEPVSEIPAAKLDVKSVFRVCQLGGSLVRVGSICSSLGESSIWKTHVTMWSVPHSDRSLDCVCSSRLLCQEGFPANLIWKLSPKENDSSSEERAVSSLIVLSEDFYAPYAVVYGFYNGDIEVVRFSNLFPEPTPEKLFLGHTGVVLCLVAHCIAGISEQQGIRRVLVSGSKDCTLRIWDMDSYALLSVMHHHVAPVRQIILPPLRTHRPWNDCFLSIGEDCLVALVSLETIRVERMFPGHLSYPSMVAWDSMRGYIDCICSNSSLPSDSVSVLNLWDVKTGARERIIRGTAAHSMFDHFCGGTEEEC